MNEVLCDCCREKVSIRVQAAKKAACIYCKSRLTTNSKTEYKNRYENIRPKVQSNRYYNPKYSDENLGRIISV